MSRSPLAVPLVKHPWFWDRQADVIQDMAAHADGKVEAI